MRLIFTFSIFLVSLLLIFSCGQKKIEDTNSSFVYASYDEVMKASAELEKPVILDFYTDW